MSDQNLLLSFGENKMKYNEEIKNAGYFVIVSNLKRTPEEILEVYKKRDAIGKSFRALKSELAFASIGVHSTISMQSKIFVAFISSIIRAYYFSLTKNLRINDSKNYTTNSIIKELEKIEATRFNGHKHSVLYKLTSIQRKILKEFNILGNNIELKQFDY